MSAAKSVLLALAAAYAALSESLTTQANELDDAAPAPTPAKGKGAAAPAPAPRAAVGGAKSKKSKGKAAEVDFETIKAKLLEQVVKDISKDAAVACLDRFGAQKLSDLSADQYEEFNTYLDQVIAGEVDPLASGETPEEEGDGLL